MSNTKLAVGDRIRMAHHWGGHEDFTVEEFRQCLGIFQSEDHRRAGSFTPLCEMYDRGPDSRQDYISNYGPYYTDQVPVWMNLPRPKEALTND